MVFDFSCAVECRDDPSCLAYEWVESEEVCYLKSRSLSGDLVKKKDSLIGFCLDEGERGNLSVMNPAFLELSVGSLIHAKVYRQRQYKGTPNPCSRDSTREMRHITSGTCSFGAIAS
ncbi:hypothetical protein ANCCAN_24210 [Ancylostoma caninum]|uniref:Apple domain-containing protein n=1 Tax=Ancylostoma caninum TaxID=29170 RepID=A0A368FCY8_ANCCA|nr:hypothetical protein ANCCAN_24210 [Ancylostoma caninum]